METPSDNDVGPPPAVRSLRSKFEQLAVETSTKQWLSGSHGELLPNGPSSPRPRASSGTYSSSHQDIHHLRTSSSSSDLNVSLKRPPPPPPRGSKGPSNSLASSPSPSSLLRLVPVPPQNNTNGSLASPRLGPPSLPTHVLPPPVNLESLESPSPSVASLRNRLRFADPSPSNAIPPSSVRVHTPRQGVSSTYPAIQPEVDNATVGPPMKPAVPPRPAKNPDTVSTSSLSRATSGSINQTSRLYFNQPSSSSSSPSSETDETPSDPTNPAPPALPARRHHAHHTEEPSTGSFCAHSGEIDVSHDLAPLPTPSRSAIPPPPLRPRTSISLATFEPTSSSSASSSTSNPTGVIPPPLPVRRNTAQADEVLAGPPRLPNRPQVIIPGHASSQELLIPAASPIERKSLGSSKLPPPPTRTIGLGDKLPPPRRPPSPSSDEDSGDEDDLKGQGVDALPDSSQSSRRPPALSFREGSSELKVHVHAFSGHACIAGTTVITAQNSHIKIYNLAVSDTPVVTLDSKSTGVKDLKVTSIAFRPSSKTPDRGFLLWVGTKDGHLLEIDVRTGVIVASKFFAHLHPVAHIFRHGRMMMTLDDSGKALIFSPEAEEDISLIHTQPRVARISEKLDFVKILGGKLWTAARAEQHSIGTASRTPVVRVYDIFTPGNMCKSLLPTEHVGPVTSATIIPSQPMFVYVGHEEGFVSVWSLDTEDGYPVCVEIMKVSTSDVLSLEGVDDKLWAGGRSGMISTYDVAQKPWMVTNCWNAHPGLPVLKLMVDHYGIEKTGRLCVASIGRDEQLRLWDGLLGLDWVDRELLKCENSFSRFRSLTVLLVSWNCDAARPDSLAVDLSNVNFLQDVLRSVDSPDIISFGFQEVIDLESRRMAAKNVLLGSKKKPEEGGLSEKVTSAYKRWYDRLVLAVRQAMPPDVPYSVIHTESLVGLFTCIFVKNSERMALSDVAITTIKRGMGGIYGNKGGIVARFVIEDSSICLINCHLAAGQNAVRQRNADVAGMLEEKAVFPATEHPIAYVGGGDGSMVLDHEIVLLNGDLNYRIDHRRDAIVAAIRANDPTNLLNYDQLLREIKYNRGCRFRGFSEGPLTFLPTYKYDRRSNNYDSSEKRRAPAWCDRILWRSRIPSRVNQLHYRRYEANVSDHRPISAAFTVTIKSVRHDVWEKAKTEAQAAWIDEQARLLSAAKEFYVSQALI